MSKTTTDLRVYDVLVEDSFLIVDLYGGPSNAFGTVRFRMTSPEAALARGEQVRQWAKEELPVALKTSNTEIVLILQSALSETEG